MVKRLLVTAFLALGAMVALASSATAGGVPYATGDVFAGVGTGLIKHFSPTGVLLDTLDTTSGSSEDTGMCFDGPGSLYSTNFEANNMTKFDNAGNVLIYPFGSGFNQDPESCVANMAGDIYVGQADGTHNILKFSNTGTPLATYGPLVTDRGTDWIDLAADQKTIFYNGEGMTIRRFDVSTNTQLADFATEPSGPCYALRIRANGDVLAACSNNVYRFDSSGTLQQTYPKPADATSFLFALNLDPDGLSFWTADFYTGNVYRINITTGAIVTEFNAAPFVDVAGLAVFGEPQVGGGGGGDTTPPTCTLIATIPGPPKAIQVEVQDIGSGLATIAHTETNAVTVVPAFVPGTTNPVVITSTKVNQSQASSLQVTVTDVAGNTTVCDPVVPGSHTRAHARPHHRLSRFALLRQARARR